MPNKRLEIQYGSSRMIRSTVENKVLCDFSGLLLKAA
jgi:hypothetical protein